MLLYSKGKRCFFGRDIRPLMIPGSATPASTRKRIPDEAWWVWEPTKKKAMDKARKPMGRIATKRVTHAVKMAVVDDVTYGMSRNFGSVVEAETGEIFEAAYL